MRYALREVWRPSWATAAGPRCAERRAKSRATILWWRWERKPRSAAIGSGIPTPPACR